MLRISFLTILTFGIIYNSFSSDYLNISGKLTDECSDEINNVRIEVLSEKGQIKIYKSKLGGSFIIDSLERNISYRLIFYRSGFFNEAISFKLSKDTFINIQLYHIPINYSPFPIAYFSFEKSTLEENYKDSLKFIITLFQQNPELHFEIIGFKDSTEHDDIIFKRTLSVLEYFISCGIDSARFIQVKSSVPNKLITLWETEYNCPTKSYIPKGDIITEEFIQSHKSKEEREKLRALNCCVAFRIIN